MVKLSYSLLLLTAVSVVGVAQTAPTANTKPDAATLLQQISKKYAAAKYYHIEAIVERETSGDLSRNWEKSVYTAAVSPGNRYHYEGHTQFGWRLKVSDGKTEINYNADYHEYTRQPAPESGPGEIKGPIFQEQFGVMTALTLLKSLSGSLDSMLVPSYIDDQDLSINGKQIPCYVIKGKARYRGGSPDMVTEVTFWIDKEHLDIRKEVVHRDGPIFIGYPEHYVANDTKLYPIMEVGVTSPADALFLFRPPADAKLVEKLSDPRSPKDVLAGTAAPAVTLSTAGGKQIELQDFHGKPVLLDFWATWCAPCVAAVEPLKKLHEDAAPKGLIMISIDEDNEADVANEFVRKHGILWSNFHDDGEIWRSFPRSNGVPFYVLIDGNGKIAFSKSAAKESELRAEIAKLGLQVEVRDGASKK
jgi:thiol-disulfide isomerase/thioredoxin